VANFRTGLFGPEGAPTANRDRVFAEFASSEATVDDWAARYLTWMGLGGTIVRIPDTVLNLVAHTPVLGEIREHFDSFVATPNMLAVAEELCRYSLPPTGFPYDIGWGDFGPWLPALFEQTPLLTKNGDVRLWLEICALDNPPPVRVIEIQTDGTMRFGQSIAASAGYPPDARVGNHLTVLDTGIQPGNLFPWCIADNSLGQAFALAHQINGENLPLCPGGLAGFNESWKLRGAINAGLLVYLFVDQITKGLVTPRYFDRCEELAP
jgi:hypothetical protein